MNHRALFAPPRRARPRRWATAIGLALVLSQLPPVALADHGGREVGSVLRCDRPVTPPRCTSVGDGPLHHVTFDASLSDGLRQAMRRTMANAYGPTNLRVVEEEHVVARTDVIAFSGDYGDNGAAAWVFCPSGVPQGVNELGDRWCRHQQMHFNLNPRYLAFFDDDASRDHVTCHELGHTLGLHHWGNPPVTDGPTGETCMQGDTPNGPTGLHPTDVDHINAYPYRSEPLVPSFQVVEAPSENLVAAHDAGSGSLMGASEVDLAPSLGALIADADLVMLGHVVDVEAGRVLGPASSPLHYAAVTVEIVEALGGRTAESGASTITLEVPMLDGPDRLSQFHAELVGTDRLMFLRNKGASAADAGLSPEEQAADRGFYRLMTFGSELVETDGRAIAPPDESGVLDLLDGRSFTDAVAAVRLAASR